MVERKDGKAVFTWKTDTIAYTPKLQNRLIQDGVLEFDEGLFQFQTPSGKPLLIHSGSVRWNDHRKRWIMIGLQSFGTSLLGEIWYSEAENLVGHCPKLASFPQSYPQKLWIIQYRLDFPQYEKA